MIELRHIVQVRLSLACGRGPLFAVNEDLSLPSRLLQVGESSFNVADELFRSITGAPSGSWAVLRQVGTFDGISPGAVVILYAAFIPEPVPPLPGSAWSWKTLAEVEANPVTHQLFGHACGFYRA